MRLTCPPTILIYPLSTPNIKSYFGTHQPPFILFFHHHHHHFSPTLPTLYLAALTRSNNARESFHPTTHTISLIPPQLVLISGYPSSGKTHRALQLKQFFDSKIADATDARIAKLRVHHINDQTLGVSRSVYHTAKAEKDARAEEYSAVKRVLTRDDIVIADGLNYIKGFRYQLYCEAKAVQTPNCVVSSPPIPHITISY